MSVKRRHENEAFGRVHWTGRGQRARARIHFRYFRRIERDWRVLARGCYHYCMNSRFIHWKRVALGRYRRDPGLRAATGRPSPWRNRAS